MTTLELEGFFDFVKSGRQRSEDRETDQTERGRFWTTRSEKEAGEWKRAYS
jgi:ClpP class serine protease